MISLRENVECSAWKKLLHSCMSRGSLYPPYGFFMRLMNVLTPVIVNLSGKNESEARLYWALSSSISCLISQFFPLWCKPLSKKLWRRDWRCIESRVALEHHGDRDSWSLAYEWTWMTKMLASRRYESDFVKFDWLWWRHKLFPKFLINFKYSKSINIRIHIPLHPVIYDANTLQGSQICGEICPQ